MINRLYPRLQDAAHALAFAEFVVGVCASAVPVHLPTSGQYVTIRGNSEEFTVYVQPRDSLAQAIRHLELARHYTVARLVNYHARTACECAITSLKSLAVDWQQVRVRDLLSLSTALDEAIESFFERYL